MNTFLVRGISVPLDGWDRFHRLIAPHPHIRDVARPHVARWAGIGTIQKRIRHTSVSTTMIYLHLMKRPGAGASGTDAPGARAESPLDFDRATE